MVGVDARGDQVVAWTDYRSVHTMAEFAVLAATHTVGGRWSAPRRISGWNELGNGPVVAVNSSGAAVIAWVATVRDRSGSGYSTVVEATTRSAASSGWRRVARVAGSSYFLSGLAVGIDNAGQVTAIWSPLHGLNPPIESATASSATGRWQHPRAVAGWGAGGSSPQLAVNARGQTLVSWQRQVGKVEHPHAPATIQYAETVRYRPARAAWQPAKTVGRLAEQQETGGATFWAPTTPVMALDGRGGATVMWQTTRGDAQALYIAHRPADAADWKRPDLLAINPVAPVIGADGRGKLTVAWTGRHGRIAVSQSSDGSRWSHATVPGSTKAFLVWLSVGHDGNALLTWTAHHRSTHVSIQRRPNGRWTRPAVIATHGGSPQASLDRAGVATIMWPDSFAPRFAAAIYATTYPTR